MKPIRHDNIRVSPDELDELLGDGASATGTRRLLAAQLAAVQQPGTDSELSAQREVVEMFRDQKVLASVANLSHRLPRRAGSFTGRTLAIVAVATVATAGAAAAATGHLPTILSLPGLVRHLPADDRPAPTASDAVLPVQRLTVASEQRMDPARPATGGGSAQPDDTGAAFCSTPTSSSLPPDMSAPAAGADASPVDDCATVVAAPTAGSTPATSPEQEQSAAAGTPDATTPTPAITTSSTDPQDAALPASPQAGAAVSPPTTSTPPSEHEPPADATPTPTSSAPAEPATTAPDDATTATTAGPDGPATSSSTSDKGGGDGHGNGKGKGDRNGNEGDKRGRGQSNADGKDVDVSVDDSGTGSDPVGREQEPPGTAPAEPGIGQDTNAPDAPQPSCTACEEKSDDASVTAS